MIDLKNIDVTKFKGIVRDKILNSKKILYFSFGILLILSYLGVYNNLCYSVNSFRFYYIDKFALYHFTSGNITYMDSIAPFRFLTPIFIILLIVNMVLILLKNKSRLDKIEIKNLKIWFYVAILINVILFFRLVVQESYINRDFLNIILLPTILFLTEVITIFAIFVLLIKDDRYKKLTFYRFYKEFGVKSPIFIILSTLQIITILIFIYLLYLMNMEIDYYYEVSLGEYINKFDYFNKVSLFYCIVVAVLVFFTMKISTRFSFDKRKNYENMVYQNSLEDKLKSERFRTELITNVSHDIKTPLTSIINYSDLITYNNPSNEQISEYTRIIHNKSKRLKVLIEDLIEASKVGTNNISMNFEDIDLNEIVGQICGEYDEQLKKNKLELVENIPRENLIIKADGRYLWRILENLFSNVLKYSLKNSRVYLDLFIDEEYYVLSLKNISKNRLNISKEQVTDQFIRGDSSRNTEGSGLGLYIAKNLAVNMDYQFDINIKADLFEVIIKFPKVK